MPITSEQLKQLQAMVEAIVTDKEAADQATAASNQADAALATATTAASAAKIEEAGADGRLSAGVTSLMAFVDALAGPTPTPTPPPTPTPTP